MTNVSLKNFSEKQAKAWRMRYRYRWPLVRIARAMHTTPSAVSQLLRRAEVRAGLVRRARPHVILTRPRACALRAMVAAMEAQP